MSRSIAHRLGVAASVFSGDGRTAPRLARQAGFKGMLFDAWASGLSITELSASGRREFVGMLSSQDQKLIGLRMDLGPRGLAPGGDVDREISRIDAALRSAAEMQSPLLCVDLGPLPQPAVSSKPKAPISPEDAGLIIIPKSVPQASSSSNEPDSPPPDPAFVAQVNSALEEIGNLADRYSMTLALSSALAGFAALGQVIADARCPWFGIDLDPVAMLRDSWQRDEIFSAMGMLIRHVRARDAVAGAGNRIKPAAMGQGDVDWPGLLSLLDHAGYAGLVTLDPLELTDRPGIAAAGAKYLRDLSL
jgi:hypothetical protein